MKQKRIHVISIRITDQTKRILAGFRKSRNWNNADVVEQAVKQLRSYGVHHAHDEELRSDSKWEP